MRFENVSVSFISFPVSSWKFRVVVGRRLLFQVIEWNLTYEAWMDARVPTKSTSEYGKMDKATHVARIVSRKCWTTCLEAVVQDFQEFLVHDSITPQQRIEFLFTLNLSA
jgi:isochorismate hydrolase